jgi:NitT/TauT family transport system substrate-binding protein
MKKKLAIILSVILVFIVGSVLAIAIVNQRKKGVIKVNEVTHSIFYAPFYIAMTQGYFEEEGIKIQLKNGGGSNHSMTAIVSGDADIALLGPETNVYIAASGALNPPKFFAQLTQRDGSMLIGRTNNENFTWADAVGKTVIGGRNGGLPAMTLRYVIQQAGYEIGTEAGQVDLRDNVAFDLILPEYQNLNAEYCTLFEPVASAAVAQNKGYMLASIGSQSGEIPYTGFAATDSYLQKNPDKIKSFIKAIIKGYEYLTTESMENIVKALKPQFSETADIDIQRAVETYVAIEAWSASPVMKESAFDKLQEVIMNAGKLSKKISFDSVVDNSYALEVLEELAKTA